MHGLATEINDVEVVDKVDRDGDGKLSSFNLEVTADLNIDEEGGEYGDGVLGDGAKPSFAEAISQGAELEGDPRFRVLVKNTNYMPVGIFERKNFDSGGSEKTFEIKYDYSEAERYVDSISSSFWSEDLRKIIEGERDLTGLKVQYYECDYCVDNPRAIDKKVDTYRLEFGSDEELTLETPSKDQSAEVSVTAETGTGLWIDGDYKGKTPWSGDLPVDASEEELVDIRLEKDGYVKKNIKEDIDPPETVDYDLEKVKKPVVINSDPEGAAVRVDGQKIGETPVSRKYWVNKEIDIRVEGENRTEEFEDVNAPWQKNVNLEDSDSSSTGTTGSLYDYGTTYDFSYYDSLLQDIDLTGLTQASFNASAKKAKTGEEVRLDASNSYSIGYNITSFRWDLGDGTSGTGQQITHTYSSPGTYTVNLTVENSNGTERFKTKEIKVENIKPEADFTISKNTVEKGDTVKFNAAPSNDRGGSITSYSWKVDSQAIGKRSNPTFSHVFSQPGAHRVELTVFDNSGASDTQSRTITVEPPNVRPKASFKSNETSLKEGEKLGLDASASLDQDANIQTYAWNLGNGLTKTGEKISHGYNRTGNFTVKLTVIDAGGLTDNATETISVEKDGEASSSENEEEDETEEETDQNRENQSEQQQAEQDESPQGQNEQEPEEPGIEQILVNLIRTIF